MNNSNEESYEPDYKIWKQNRLHELNYNRAVCLLASGQDIATAAKTCGVSRRTLQRWTTQETFKINLHKAIKLVLSKALANASDYANRAIEILKDIAEDINCPYKYRLQAIKNILEFSTREPLRDAGEPHQEFMEKLNTFAQAKSLLATSRQYDLPPISQQKAIENTEIWEQIYPDEPYPDEENLRKHFKQNYLDEYD